MSLVRDPKGTIWDDESLEKALTEVLTAEVDEDTAQGSRSAVAANSVVQHPFDGSP